MNPQGRTAAQVTRPFHWGVVIVGDPAARTVPELAADGGINHSSSLVVIPVRHTQDVEDTDHPQFDVEIRCNDRTGGFTGAGHHVLIELPTGEMSIGDAEDELLFSPGPGWWWTTISLTPASHAEVVEIQLSRAVGCPVCRWPGLMEQAWTDRSPSHEICPSCRTEFGYDDAIGFTDLDALSLRHKELQQAWVDGGMKWWSESRRPPAGWRPSAQE